MPSLRPATAERTGARGLRPLVATSDDNSGLRLTTELFLDLASPLLHIRHGLSNLRDERRRITALALNIIRLDHGSAAINWGSVHRRSLLFWPNTGPN